MRKFFKYIIIVFLPPTMVVVAATIFYFANRKDITGDIGRINQKLFSEEYRKSSKFSSESSPFLFRTSSLNSTQDENIKLLFIGDSFTYLTVFADAVTTSLKSSSILFINNYDLSPEQVLINNIDSIKNPIVILESVERDFIKRLCELDFRGKEPFLNTENVKNSGLIQRKIKKVTTFYKNNLFRGDAVKSAKLNIPLFTCENETENLYFYNEDLNFPTQNQIYEATRKLDTLFDFTKERNILLFYVVAADKYEIYQKYIEDNPYPTKQTLDIFDEIERENPCFINTKIFLLPLIEKGVTDVYYVDDTHWSPVGAKVVADSVSARIFSKTHCY